MTKGDIQINTFVGGLNMDADVSVLPGAGRSTATARSKTRRNGAALIELAGDRELRRLISAAGCGTIDGPQRE